MHVSMESAATEFSRGKWGKRRFNPRSDILKEVVAGFIWIELDLSKTVTRAELETVAHRLVQRINADASARMVEDELVFLQRDQFCRPVQMEVIRDLVRQTVSTVKGSSV